MVTISFDGISQFQCKRGDPESESKIFSVPDFIGFCCRQIGESMVLGAKGTHISCQSFIAQETKGLVQMIIILDLQLYHLTFIFVMSLHIPTASCII